VLSKGDLVEGRYRILDTIDEGGMGTVLLAEHVLIKRKVAIKLLREELATDPVTIERFMNEASVAGQLGHPNIVESTDMGFTNGVPFIVFEYLEGALLTSEVYRLSGLTVRRALRIANQIASALEAAHNAGIVHRDLKTDNIFLLDREDSPDHVKVLDFGVSRFVTATEEKVIIGTPEYMAPEQIMSPDKVDRRADIYALGVVLYEMITARRPFQKDADGDTSTLLHRIVHEAPPSLTRGEAPMGLQEMLFSKLLAKDPAQRYQTMKDVQGAIATFHGLTRSHSTQLPLSSAPHSATLTPIPRSVHAPTPVADTAPVPAARGRGGAIAALLVAIVLASAGIALTFVPPEIATTTTTPQTALDDDGRLVAAALEAAANANQLRAESLATAPMVRAAIETDRATLHDMVATGDFVFKPKQGEILEIFQKTEMLVRMPADAVGAGAAPGIRYLARGGQVLAVAGVPIKTQIPGSSNDGLIVIASPVDLASAKQRIGEHTLGAALVGLDERIILVGANRPGTAATAQVNVAGSKPLSLDVVIPTPISTSTDRFATARRALWGSGGLAFMIFLGLLLLRRREH
jgi:tRNA A-37 threonylcarbamoyl transferase component Bud32